MSYECSYSTMFTIFNYQRTIFDTLPTRYPISVILRQSVTSFDITPDTSTALAVGRRLSTRFPRYIRLLGTLFDIFRLHSVVSVILGSKPQVRLWLIMSNMGFLKSILSFPGAFCQIASVFVEFLDICRIAPMYGILHYYSLLS